MNTPFEKLTLITQALEEMLLKNMYKWLEGRVHDPKQFCKWLKRTGAFMAGSGPLQFLMGEEWDYDMDIYIMWYKNEKMKVDVGDVFSALTGHPAYTTSDNCTVSLDYLKKSKLLKNVFRTIKVDDKRSITVCSTIANHYGEFCCLLKYGLTDRKYWGEQNSSCYTESAIVQIGEYFYYDSSKLCTKCKTNFRVNNCCENGCYDENKKPIQIIHINSEKYKDVRSFVQNFDLDFCKVTFDGEKFEILNPESLLTKTSIYHKHPEYTKEVMEIRKKKYEDRGFTITMPPPSDVEVSNDKELENLDDPLGLKEFE